MKRYTTNLIKIYKYISILLVSSFIIIGVGVLGAFYALLAQTTIHAWKMIVAGAVMWFTARLLLLILDVVAEYFGP